MDVKQIEKIIKLAEESGMSEVIVEEGDQKITLRKALDSGALPVLSSPQPIASAEVPHAVDVISPSVSPGDRPASWKSIDSPMVGVFYAAPSPDADDFVSIGAEVRAGDTLCIVEAMKLMNEVSAEEVGIIREICAKNSDLVEYGTPLFYFEPS
jgi:oxaloacetate decarboxylase alpha subunit